MTDLACKQHQEVPRQQNTPEASSDGGVSLRHNLLTLGLNMLCTDHDWGANQIAKMIGTVVLPVHDHRPVTDTVRHVDTSAWWCEMR